VESGASSAANTSLTLELAKTGLAAGWGALGRAADGAAGLGAAGLVAIGLLVGFGRAPGAVAAGGAGLND
jgi:hypothetical protein